MKKLLSLILLTMLVITSLPCLAAGQEADSKGTITVGIDASYPPFEYYEDGKLSGFDVDLMNYIGERTGYDIEYVEMSFDKLLSSVVNGEVDCAISAITVTEERDEIIDYSREYLMTNIITFEDGQKSRKRGEYYAIVFREGLSGSPYDEIENPTADEALYIMVDEALRDLSQDRTVMKLIEKYELNKPLDENAEYNIEYQDIRGDGSPAAKTSDEEKPLTETFSCSQWAEDDMEKALESNIINYGGNYNFTAPITREEFCELIYNYCANVIGMLEPSPNESIFTDTDNSHVRVLNAVGIIKGKSETEFAPKDLLTREEAAVILSRMVNKTIPVPVTEMWFEFDDIDYISDWAMDAVQTMCNMNVMNGVGSNTFAPKGAYTTEQAIAAIVRVFEVQSANTEIIGGADGYTDVVIADGNFVLKITDKDGNVILNHSDVLSCHAENGKVNMAGENEWFLEVLLSAEGRSKFREATKRVSEYPSGENYLAVFVNEQIITMPTVLSEIDSETVLITGDFTEEGAKNLEAVINSAVK